MQLTSKQRAYLISLGQTLDPVVQVGKAGVSPETVVTAEEAFHNRELLKGTVLKTAPDDPAVSADKLAARTHSEIVKVIGRKFLLFKPFKEDPKIVLPR